MNPLIVEQIAESGLTIEDIEAREATVSELTACMVPQSTSGYVIPYYDMHGKLLPYYRLRLFDHQPKYKQVRNSPNHVYFPKNFLATVKGLMATTKEPYIMITEGERKAAAAVKNGIPCVGLGGVDNWRTRIVNLPPGTSLTAATKGKVKWTQAKLPTTSGISEASQITFAQGLVDLIKLVRKYNLRVLICFDTDLSSGLKPEVQRACWALGNELRFQGISLGSIKQVILPFDHEHKGKIALDDFLIHQGIDDIFDLIEYTISVQNAFPRHPDPRSYIAGRLERGKISRRESQELAVTILSELDSHGKRMRDISTQSPFYFDSNSKRLMEAGLTSTINSPIHETHFGVHLYREFGISGADQKLLTWLATQYTGENPIHDVSPVKVMTEIKDKSFGELAIQVSDSEFVVVTSDSKQPIKICSNGTRDLLFMQGQVETLDTEKLIQEVLRQLKEPIKPWWREVLETMNLVGKYSKDYMSLLFYVSPFLSRWYGMQLPVEVLCGEAGSGKSSLYALRLSILTGRPLLRNIPEDIRDWNSGITSTGGLYVIDNVQFTDKGLRQRISDEICRIITEPNPHVEMRRLYTTATQLSVPVQTTFAFTSIQQPFFNADFLQRAAVFELEALTGTSFDGNWLNHTLESRGGREAWLAHQLCVLHQFFVLAKDKWDSNRKASHRLAHFEQCMELFGEVLNIDTTFLQQELVQRTVESIASSDWTMQGIKEFAQHLRDEDSNTEFTVVDIIHWAGFQDEYNNNSYLKSSRQLGSYMGKHKNDIQKVCSILQLPDKKNNRIVWSII